MKNKYGGKYNVSEVSFYLPTFSGRPIQYLFDTGWRVSLGFKFLGIIFIRYSK